VTESWFVREHSHRMRRRRRRASLPLTWISSTSQRPASFAIHPQAWCPEESSFTPPMPPAEADVDQYPVDRRYWLGRVVAEATPAMNGSRLAIVWRWPGGQEDVVALPDFAPVGALVRRWTWWAWDTKGWHQREHLAVQKAAPTAAELATIRDELKLPEES